MQDGNNAESSSESFLYYFQPALSSYLLHGIESLFKDCLFRTFFFFFFFFFVFVFFVVVFFFFILEESYL